MVYVCTLSKEIQEQAKRELNEDEKRRDEDIEYIRKWIQKQPHLKIRTDDEFILRMLRGCKFSLERTKEKIDMHYTIKAAIPEWFKNRDPEDPKVREIFKLGVMFALKEKDDKGRTIFMFRQSAYSPDLHHVDDVVKAMYILVDVYAEIDEVSQITGLVMILDMKGLTAGHMLQFPPTVMKKSMVLWQGVCNSQQVSHYINSVLF
ncbi:Alpha-tocopherol transfer protein-like [Armadillidium vulgare]|nr:Alpha-tocopherol transfer protein-like [Armadillidium vulgare]